MKFEKKAFLLVDLLFGDSTKGAYIDFLARYLKATDRELSCVILSNGGSQKAHNVVLPNGIFHCFHQFCSAMFVPEVRTHLSKYMIVNPIKFYKELEELSAKGVPNVLSRTTVDRRVKVVTMTHIAANRLREYARGENRIGTCGHGIGETQSDFDTYGDDRTLYVDDLEMSAVVRKKLLRFFEAKRSELADQIQEFANDPQMVEEIQTLTNPSLIEDSVRLYKFFANQVTITDEDYLQDLLNKPGIIAFEPGQGALLDQTYGFVPYVTPSNTTLKNQKEILQEGSYDGEQLSLGLFRGAGAHRHGAGPLPTEDPSLKHFLDERFNKWNLWQQDFRVGHLDLVLLRYALEIVGGVDYLGVSHLDQFLKLPAPKAAAEYKNLSLQLKRDPDRTTQTQLTHQLLQAVPNYFDLPQTIDGFLAFLESQLATPVGLISQGPTHNDRSFLRPIF